MKDSQSEVLIPKYYEFESMRKTINRKYLPVVILSMLLAFVSMGFAFLAFARPIPVVVFDSQGQPILFEDTSTARMTMDNVRVEWFVTKFAKLWVGVDSANIQQDLQTSLNMMTPVLRKIILDEGAELSRRNEYKDANIRSLFDEIHVRIGKYDPNDFEGKISTLVTGRMTFVPRYGQLEPGPGGETGIEKWFFTQVVIQRTPVRTNSVHGMLVHYVQTTLFDEKGKLEAYLARKASRP